MQCDETYCGVAVKPFIGDCASVTVHVTRCGTDADIGFPSYICSETFMSSAQNMI